MNRIKLLLVILTLSTSASFAQEVANPEVETLRQKNERDQRIYELALRYNDLAAARITLIGLMERNPTNSRYGELLATIYFENNQFSSAALTALDVLQLDDRSIEAMEVAAYSLEQIGALDRALTQFERLYLLTDDIFSLYKSAYLQYALKKHEEALNSINMIVKNTKSAEQKLGFPADNDETQEVSMQAAALNLKGMVYIEQGSKEDARKAFEEALAIEPNFILAKEGLKGL
jgi:tetratricopeptide (TPR) repeat protein